MQVEPPRMMSELERQLPAQKYIGYSRAVHVDFGPIFGEKGFNRPRLPYPASTCRDKSGSFEGKTRI